MRQQHVSPSTPGKCWKQKTTKKGKQRNLDGLLLLLLQPTVDQITKEKSKCSKIRERNCWPKQSPVFSIRCSCCLRSKYMRELLDKDCADITDPQSYAETWLSFPSPDGSRKNGDEIKEPSLRTADFLLAHRRWETFREEKSLRLSDRNSILMTQNLSGIRSEALIGRRSSSSWTVPQRRMSEEKRLPFAG